MHRKAPLSITAWDQKMARKDVNPRLSAEPHKPLAEVMSDEELLEYVSRDIVHIANLHAEARKGSFKCKRTLVAVRDTRLIPDMIFLRQIGRLPAEWSDFDPVSRFAL
jgi:hypothetical protein